MADTVFWGKNTLLPALLTSLNSTKDYSWLIGVI